MTLRKGVLVIFHPRVEKKRHLAYMPIGAIFLVIILSSINKIKQFIIKIVRYLYVMVVVVALPLIYGSFNEIKKYFITVMTV